MKTTASDATQGSKITLHLLSTISLILLKRHTGPETGPVFINWQINSYPVQPQALFWGPKDLRSSAHLKK